VLQVPAKAQREQEKAQREQEKQAQQVTGSASVQPLVVVLSWLPPIPRQQASAASR
jgi:membrane protein YqaA with SNARE-associated domain